LNILSIIDFQNTREMSSDAKDILGSLVVPSTLQKEPKRTKKEKTARWNVK